MAFHGFCTCLKPGNGFLEPVSQPFLKVNGHISEPQVLGLSSPTKRLVEKSKLGSTSSWRCTLQSLFLPPVRFSAGAMKFYGLCAVGMNCSKIIQCYRVYGEAPKASKFSPSLDSQSACGRHPRPLWHGPPADATSASSPGVRVTTQRGSCLGQSALKDCPPTPGGPCRPAARCC